MLHTQLDKKFHRWSLRFFVAACDETKPTKHQVFVLFFDIRMDEDSSMTVDWREFLHHVILNPVENIGELVSSWKHSLVRSVAQHKCA